MPTVNVDASGQLLYAGTDPYLVVNNDDTKAIYLSQQQGVNGADNTLPAQASVALTGPWYASTLTQGEVVEALVFPDATQWDNPVGVQIALNALGLATADNQTTQITHEANTDSNTNSTVQALFGTAFGTPSALVGAANLTISKDMLHANTGVTTEIAALIASGSPSGTPGGVPLLKNHNKIGSHATASVATGTPLSVGPFAFNQIGYSLFFEAYVTTGSTLSFVEVNIEWTDVATGFTVDQQTYWLYVGSSSSSPHNVRITGPTEGNEVTVTFSAFGSAVTIADMAIFQSSTVYGRHFPLTTVMTTLAGVTNVAFTDPLAFILGDISATSVNASSNLVTVPAFYSGRAQIFGGTSSGAADMTLSVTNSSDQGSAGGHNVFEIESDSKGFVNEFLYLPREQCEIAVANNNASAQTLRWTLVAAPEG